MIRTGLAVVVVAVFVTSTIAQTDVVKERNALMYAMDEEGYGPLTKMVRGEDAYDQAKVDAAFARFAENAGKLPALWPAGSQGTAEGSDHHSSAKVWENKSDFDARLAKLAKDVADNRAKATNLENLKIAFQPVKDDCAGYHEIYRVRNR